MLATQLNNVTDPNDCLVVGDTYHRGAAIAIAIAACAFLLLLVSGWAFWYRRSNRRAVSSQASDSIPNYTAAFYLGLGVLPPRKESDLLHANYTATMPSITAFYLQSFEH